jgi:hypothetical protein
MKTKTKSNKDGIKRNWKDNPAQNADENIQAGNDNSMSKKNSSGSYDPELGIDENKIDKDADENADNERDE